MTRKSSIGASGLMRVLQICPGTTIGGAELYLLPLALEIIRRGGSVTLACSNTATLEPLRNAYRSQKAEVIAGSFIEQSFMPWSGRLDLLRRASKYLPLFLRARPNLIHISLPWPIAVPGAIVAATLLRIPTVLTFQLVTNLQISEYHCSLYHWSLKNGHKWITVSYQNRDLLSQLFSVNKDNITVIYNGVSDNCSRSSVTQDHSSYHLIRKTIGIHDNGLLALAVGRLEPQKGHETLIRAIARINSQSNTGSRIWCCILGDGSLRDHLSHLIYALKMDEYIKLLGHKNDVSSFLRAADFFIFPSLYEGAPFALLEAMMNGLPVVASKFGGVEEFISHGKNGLLFNIKDDFALANILSDLSINREKCGALGIAARNHVLNNFTLESMINKTLSIFEQYSRQ